MASLATLPFVLHRLWFVFYFFLLSAEQVVVLVSSPFFFVCAFSATCDEK